MPEVLEEIKETVDRTKDELMDVKLNVAHLRADFDNHAKYTSEALNKNEALMDARLTGMNEFRMALADQTKSYMTRAEYESAHRLIEAKLDATNRLVYIGAGILLMMQIAVGVVLHFI